MAGEEIALAAPRTTNLASWWSVERLLYAAALVIGVSLRLWGLGSQPLSPWEASNSWPAWLAANGLSVVDAPTPNSALYYGLQWLLFWTGVNSDAGARLISVIAGTGLIVLPWWWRGWCGRRVALIMSWLLTVDPWLLGFSRMADGASLAIFCGLLTLVGMSQVAVERHANRWMKISTVAAGLLLVSGPMGWNFLLVVIWWGWLLKDELAVAGLWQRKWLMWMAGAALAGATFWFARLEGVAWVATGVSVWLAQFDGGNAGPLLPPIMGGYGIAWPWLQLWVDAAPLLPLGMGGLVVLTLRARRYETAQPVLRPLLHLYIGWLLWGMLLWLLPGRSPLALPVLGMPLLILTAYALDALLSGYPRELDWREAGAVVFTLTILLISGALWSAALLANRSYDPVLAQATFVIFGLGLAILVAFALWANRNDAAWVAASLIASLLLILYVRSSWRLNYANVVIEPSGWQATMAHPEVRLLVGDIETLSSHRAGDPYQLPVQVQMAAYVTGDDQVVPARPDPVLGWELRKMRNLTWVSSPLVASDSVPLPLVVTPASVPDDTAPLDLPDSYVGSRYHVDTWWLPRTLMDVEAGQEESTTPVEDESSLARLWAARLQPWWRWIVYREATEAPRNRDVILWAPLDGTAQ
jgi:hypothetical protein